MRGIQAPGREAACPSHLRPGLNIVPAQGRPRGLRRNQEGPFSAAATKDGYSVIGRIRYSGS